ncbi:MAG: AAA family ATPase [Trueperaceae bacterium]|nr:AAA family ATPase [Trueperaceae bacterium]
MALEELIVAWSKDRPAWQREVMRRLAAGDRLSTADYDQLVDDIVAGKLFPEATFGLAQLPRAAPEDQPVRLLSIEKPEHVNALESKDPLTFDPHGMTIIYGDNASGKSGYARLLKRITRARHQEEVLSDVFRDTALAKPSAILAVRIGDNTVALTWPESARPELQRMLFYDGVCGNAYIATESDFLYRPSALFVMDALIAACVEVRNRIDIKLVENGSRAETVPVVQDYVRDTDAGSFLTLLSGRASIEAMDALIRKFDQSSETVEELQSREGRLRSADTSKERQNLFRQSQKLEALRKHLEQINAVFGAEGLLALGTQRGVLRALEIAADRLARSFESEPLSGVGSSPWKALWESAKRFSEANAYAGKEFPVVVEDCRCVLCQQPLQSDARERFSRFKSFVNDDTQVRLREARQIYDRQVERLTSLAISSEAATNNVKDLEPTHRDIAAEVGALLKQYESARKQTLGALANPEEDIPQPAIDPGTVTTRLTEASKAAMACAEELANPDAIRKQLAELTRRRAELELLQEVKKSRDGIVKEIGRLKEREALDAAKSAAATGPITKKILELSEQGITEVVRDTFTREGDRLRLERVTIARTRADKGALLHQTKLVGVRQQVTLPRVFSEGERTALGLAAFFTEADLDASNSAIILDDPVTSLDHIRRGLVAARLAALAELRQVIVFTHDVSFVADLTREAKGKGVPIAERSVTRSRAGERKPGVCSTAHPWKAKDVPARLDELRKDLARVKGGTMDQQAYEDAVSVWAGNLSETWERIFSQEIVGAILAEGGLEVRPMMVKILARFSDSDYQEFQASYSRASQWAKRHDKSARVNFVAPDVRDLEVELARVDTWFKRVKGYKS